jgi:hypothetical protein
VDIELRQNRHQALAELTPMAYAVLRAVAVRLERDRRLTGPGDEAPMLLVPTPGGLDERALELVERPPFGSLGAA